MVAEGPVDPQLLAQLLEIEQAEIEATLQELMASYEVEDRGFILTKVAGGYRYQSHPDQAPYVERFVLDGQHARLSPASMETLAIVAYKQPISRGQMSAIRGVNVEATLTTLLQRGYVQEVGRDPGPGAAVLYGNTREFLERLGLPSLEQLPPLGDFVPAASVVEALERGLRVNDDPTVTDPELTEPAIAEPALSEPDPVAPVAVTAVEVEAVEIEVVEVEVVEVDVVVIELDDDDAAGEPTPPSSS